MTAPRRSVDKIAFVILCGLSIMSLWARFPQCSYGLPASLYPDRVFTVEVAQRLADEWRAGIWTLDPKQYVYPTTYINMLAAAYFVLGRFFHREAIGRFITMLFGVCAIFTGYFISGEIAGTAAALISAVLLSTGFLFFKEGRYPTVDSVQMFFISAALLFLFKARHRPWAWTFLSGLLAGVAMGTKYTAVLYLAPILAVLWLWPDENRSVRERIATGSRWIAAAAVGFFISTPAIFFKFPYFARDFISNKEIQNAGFIKAGPAHYFTLLFSTQTIAPEVPFANSLRGGLGLPFVIVALVSLVFIALDLRRENDPRPLALSVSMVATYVYFYAAIGNHVLRYLLPLAFMSCVTVSIFIVRGSRWIAGYFQRPWTSRVAALLMLSALALVVYPNFEKSKNYRDALRHEDTRVQTVDWMLQHVPRGSRVLNFMYGPSLPPGLFNAVVWQFPEVLYQLKTPAAQAPRLNDLREQKIEWIIWNSYYTDHFFTDGGTLLEQAYADRWKDFFDGLKKNSISGDGVVLEGTISPTIHVFHLKKS